MKSVKASDEKYFHYLNSAQAPAGDAHVLAGLYRRYTKRAAKSMTEDFCGTAALCCEWVKAGADRVALGVDLDPEPLSFGQRYLLTELSNGQRKRITLKKANVLSVKERSDIVCALNFSYSIIHTRSKMLAYFRGVRARLNAGGIFVLDNFGGSEYLHPRLEKRRCGTLGYQWEMKRFDVMWNIGDFAIHFKPKGKPAQRDAFTYHWRMWSIPELRDLLVDAGFKDVHIHWEGTAPDGYGNGVYREVKKVNEHCLSWVCYVVARK